MELSEKQLDAMIALLDDPDERIYREIKEKLLEVGNEAIPALEKAWEENDLGGLFRSRIENIIHTVQLTSITDGLANWRKNPNGTLLEAMLLINRFQYPDLKTQEITEYIEQLVRDASIEISRNHTALQKVRRLNKIMFDIHGFSGNRKNYHAVQNSYISDVISTKKGNPVTLAIIYIIVARRLKIPIYGVNLPNHFVLTYVDESEKRKKPLFYINPFSKGTVFSKSEINHFLEQLNLEPKPSYFAPCTDLAIVKRVLNNLVFGYEKQGDLGKVEELKALYNSLYNG